MEKEEEEVEALGCTFGVVSSSFEKKKFSSFMAY